MDLSNASIDLDTLIALSNVVRLSKFRMIPNTLIEFHQLSCTQAEDPKEQSIIALAAAVDLCMKRNPSTKVYKVGSTAIKRLLDSLKSSTRFCFPFVKNVCRVGLLGCANLPIYCYCRQVDLKNEKMIECSSCLEWFHCSCANESTKNPSWYIEGLEWFCSFCSQENHSSLNVSNFDVNQLKLLSNGFSVGSLHEKLSVSLTCTIDSALMIFHAHNSESNGSIENFFLSSDVASVKCLGEVLSECRTGDVDQARLKWIHFIKVPIVKNQRNVEGPFYDRFSSHFSDLLTYEYTSTCSNELCNLKCHITRKRGIVFDRLMTDTVSDLSSAVEQLFNDFVASCNHLGVDDGNKTIDLTRSCSGIRIFQNAVLVGPTPPLLIMSVSSLKLSLRKLSPVIHVFGQTYRYLGSVFGKRNHFTCSFQLSGINYYFDDLHRMLSTVDESALPDFAFYILSF